MCCIENRGGGQHGNFWCVFYWISLVFFAKYYLFRLRNTPTKFREATISICGVMWKLCQNASIAIQGAFLIGFLSFFLLNIIYLGYEIWLQSFVRLHQVIVKLCVVQKIGEEVNMVLRFLVSTSTSFHLYWLYVSYSLQIPSWHFYY